MAKAKTTTKTAKSKHAETQRVPDYETKESAQRRWRRYSMSWRIGPPARLQAS
jgi:hypothetical protein